MPGAGFIYEKNNFTTYVDTESARQDYHRMMEFMKKCKLAYSMLEAPTIYCEMVEEIWISAVFVSTNCTLTFFS